MRPLFGHMGSAAWRAGGATVGTLEAPEAVVAGPVGMPPSGTRNSETGKESQCCPTWPLFPTSFCGLACGTSSQQVFTLE